MDDEAARLGATVDPPSRPSRALAAERAAFRAMFEEQFKHVWHTLRRYGVHAQDLEDLTHEVFVTFYRRRADYDVTRPLGPWLGGIAFRVAVAHRRLARHAAEVLGDGEAALGATDGTPLPDSKLALKQDLALVMEALDAVDLERRAVLVMHDLDGTAMPEIAHALGIHLNTAYSRLRLAREDFRAAVQRGRRRLR